MHIYLSTHTFELCIDRSFFYSAICKYIVGITWHWAWDMGLGKITIMMIDDGGGAEKRTF